MVMNFGADMLLGLVLFFCTFLSLRSHDLGQPYTHIRDFELQGEAEHFGAYVLIRGWSPSLTYIWQTHP